MTLVTGGASGLGRATVERFLKKGSNVVICDLPTSAGSQMIKDLGERAHYVNADVTSETDVKNLINEVENKFGKLDVLVNCAGRANAYVTFNFNSKKPRSLEDFKSIIEVKKMHIQFNHAISLILFSFHFHPLTDECSRHFECYTLRGWTNCKKYTRRQ